MNTTTNTRGVSEAMVERFKAAFAEHSTISPAYDGCIRAALEAALSAEQGQSEDGMQPSRPKPRMPISPLGIEDFCYCDNTVSLQAVSGGAAPEGYLGKVRLKVNGEFVTYVREATAPPAQPAARVPEGWVLVPREPTDAMLEAAMQREDDEPLSDWGKVKPASHAEIYKAMLAASPAPSPARGDGGEG